MPCTVAKYILLHSFVYFWMVFKYRGQNPTAVRGVQGARHPQKRRASDKISAILDPYLNPFSLGYQRICPSILRLLILDVLSISLICNFRRHYKSWFIIMFEFQFLKWWYSKIQNLTSVCSLLAFIVQWHVYVWAATQSTKSPILAINNFAVQDIVELVYFYDPFLRLNTTARAWSDSTNN